MAGFARANELALQFQRRRSEIIVGSAEPRYRLLKTKVIRVTVEFPRLAEFPALASAFSRSFAGR